MVDSARVYGHLVRAQVRSQLQYRASFALDLAGTFLITFLDFVAIVLIFHNVPQLGTWTVHEVAFLYAISCIAFALTDLVVGHLDDFPQLIRLGTFDILLVRPRGTLFQVVASDLALRRLGKAVQGLVVLVYALMGVDVPWDAGRVAVVALMIPAGAVLYGAVWVIGACIAFWTTEGGEVTNAFTYGGNFLTQYPIDIYGRWARRLLAYAVPLAFVAYFPALYVLDKPDPLGLPRILQFMSPAVALATAAVAGLVWRAAVRRYRSAGG